MKDDGRIRPLKSALFAPGRVTITPEAFQCLKDAGLTPADLVHRHTRGDWDGAPVKWIARNHDVVHGGEEGPVMSVYRLHPGETRICVGTTSDRSGTSLAVWPQPDGHRPAVPVETAERICKDAGRMSAPATGRNVSEIFAAWDRNREPAGTRLHAKGPKRYGPDR